MSNLFQCLPALQEEISSIFSRGTLQELQMGDANPPCSKGWAGKVKVGKKVKNYKKRLLWSQAVTCG